MDYSKIKLANERNSHVTKRLNRLNTWKFFTVLYRENVWRIFGFSLLMILCVAPIFVVLILGSLKNSAAQQLLPMINGFGFSTGPWLDLENYYTSLVEHNSLVYGAIAVGASVLVSIMLSGGFAVIRDAFWTGKLSTVGVFKSIGKGIAANILYAIVSVLLIAGMVFGLFVFYGWASVAMPLWLAIVLLVLMCIAAMFVAIYLLILCSVSVTYKQSLKDNLDDSWRLMWLNIFPNIIHFLIMCIPVALYFLFSTGMLQSLYMVILIMFGGLYFPLVWQTFMMKTFALFHPVEPKKKNKKPAMQQSEKYLAQKAAQGKNVKRNPRAVLVKTEESAEISENVSNGETETVETAGPDTEENTSENESAEVSDELDPSVWDAAYEDGEEDK